MVFGHFHIALGAGPEGDQFLVAGQRGEDGSGVEDGAANLVGYGDEDEGEAAMPGEAEA